MALLFILTVFSVAILAAPLQNITITVPEGTSNHGDPRLLCTPTTATDVAKFFFGNYLAHVATVVALPGEAAIPAFLSMVSALFYPVSGLRRGIDAIQRHACFPWRNPLKTALRAGALCEVVRLPDWKPEPGDHIPEKYQDGETPEAAGRTDGIDATEDGIQRNRGGTAFVRLKIDRIRADCFFHTNSSPSFSGRHVHGHCSLPQGYALAIVPPYCKKVLHRLPNSSNIPTGNDCGRKLKKGLKKIPGWYFSMLLKFIFFRHVRQPGPRSRNHPVHSLDSIHSSVPALRISVSIFQLIYASFTLYHTKGDQIHRYGYAAFGLTVTPYLFMSFVNLLGSLLTPSYPCVYLIQTNIMIEARLRKDGEFDGVVGVIDDQWVEAPSTKLKSWSFTNKIYHDLLPEIRQISKKLSSYKDQVQQTLQKFSSWYEARVEPIWQVLLPFFDVLGVAKAKETDHQLWETKRLDNKELEFTGERLRDEGQSVPKVRINYSVIERKTMNTLARLSIMRDLCIYMGCLPFVIIGSLSRFENGNSTTAQRAWTMIWLVVGILLGPDCYESIGTLSNSVASLTAFNLFKIQGIDVLSVFAYGVAPIGGMVVVGQMLLDYGSCVRMY